MNPFAYKVYSTKNPFNVTDNIETPEDDDAELYESDISQMEIDNNE